MKLVRALHIILLDVIYVMIAIVFRNLGALQDKEIAIFSMIVGLITGLGLGIVWMGSDE